MRSDARYCSKQHRQSGWRFYRKVGRHERRAEHPMRLAYADPPYPGLAHYYAEHPDYAGEVDHGALIERLCGYDGWALSTSEAGLFVVVPIVKRMQLPGVRVGSWRRGSVPGAARGPRGSWEPVLYKPARAELHDWCDDSLVWTSRPRLSDPKHVIGAKPATFADWLFKLLGARGGDSLDDLFPGSGGIARAWARFSEIV